MLHSNNFKVYQVLYNVLQWNLININLIWAVGPFHRSIFPQFSLTDRVCKASYLGRGLVRGKQSHQAEFMQYLFCALYGNILNGLILYQYRQNTLRGTLYPTTKCTFVLKVYKCDWRQYYFILKTAICQMTNKPEMFCIAKDHLLLLWNSIH